MELECATLVILGPCKCGIWGQEAYTTACAAAVRSRCRMMVGGRDVEVHTGRRLKVTKGELKLRLTLLMSEVAA